MTNSIESFNIYNKYENMVNLNNKLFCTFTPLEKLEELLENIVTNYTVKYNKIFVLKVKNNDECVCTYNIELGNLNEIFPNTILVHRKKESNTLYTINALNEVIRGLNFGIVDPHFQINWLHYKNSILLTQQDELKQLKTKIYRIIDI